MKKLIEKEILKIKSSADEQIIAQFLKQLNSGSGPTKQQNPQNHFCAFCIPIDIQNKTILLGHHIKADSWIPPGGHIDQGEGPLDTVRREFAEELQHNLISEPIELYTASIIQIDNPKQTCKTHYDLWYLVYIDEQSFKFDTNEFYDMKWFPLSVVDTIVTHPIYQPLMINLKKYLIHAKKKLGDDYRK